MEAARINMNRRLMDSIGKNGFHLKIRTYPHHVLREHKYATGAGADRVSEGMRLAFGKPVGTAARVAPRQKVFTIWTTKDNVEKAKDALLHAGHKLPTPVRVIVEE